jgi:uncharacterized protein DUF2800
MTSRLRPPRFPTTTCPTPHSVTIAHSKIGASSMYRWSVCPGSVRECAKLPSYSSAYADDGTRAHDMAAQCLRAGKLLVEIFDDAEQMEAVAEYVDYVLDLVEPGDVLLVEHKFDLSAVYPGCFGTADAAIYKPAQKLLIVPDYKHGAGLAVEVTNNPQGRYYALGALLTCGFVVNRVCIAIVQPRCPHPAGSIREEEMDAIDLLDFRADLIGYAKATEDENAPLRAGDHCRFCPAAGVCPALHAEATRTAMVEFKPALPYDPAKLAAALGMRDAVKAWLKNIDEFAYREAEAGRCPPGYKLVAKRATRSWESDGRASELLSDLGLTDAQIYEPRAVRSPAQIEALFPRKALPADVTAIVRKESSGHTLVPESDARPAAKPAAVTEFTPVPQTERKAA